MIHPDGSELIGYGSFIMPKVVVFPNMAVYTIPICGITPNRKNDGTFSKGTLNLVDLRNIYFGTDDALELLRMDSTICFTIFTSLLYGIWCPKYTSNICILTTYYNIPRGIHLGKCFARNSPDWLFGTAEVDPSEQAETPVYCDKDFLVDEAIYLEKLNIPRECLIDMIKNLATLELDEYCSPILGYSPILSIGEFNKEKVWAEFYEIYDQHQEELDAIYDAYWCYDENDLWEPQITREEAIERLKPYGDIVVLDFEFYDKGWDLR